MRSIVAVCLLVWGCQGQKNNILSTSPWLETYLTESPTYCFTDNKVVGQCVKLSECMDSNKLDLQKKPIYRELSCDYLKICCPTSRLMTPTSLPPKRAGCGWSNPGSYVFRDSSKTYAELGEFPWMVALMRNNQNQDWNPKDALGGGSLIHHSVVMTVAHKLNTINNDPSLIKCRLGELNRQNTKEIYPHQDRDVRKVLVHEHFSLCNMGWGKDLNYGNNYAVSLKKVPLPIVDQVTCAWILHGVVRNFWWQGSFLCAGGRYNFATRTGDEGSSLACRTSSDGAPPRYTVYGMSAIVWKRKGVDCCLEVPALYVNVPAMVSWITDKFYDEKLDLTFFP